MEVMTFGNLEIDLRRRELRLDGNVVPCKPKEFDLLTFLGQHKARVMNREIILDRVWGWGFVGDSRTLDVHIRWLRKKIEPDPDKPVRIVTVRGSGYRFEG
jgi:DNA-binding response OmpR family regulator